MSFFVYENSPQHDKIPRQTVKTQGGEPLLIFFNLSANPQAIPFLYLYARKMH